MEMISRGGGGLQQKETKSNERVFWSASPPRNTGCCAVRRDEMKTIDNHRRFLQLAQKVTFAPWDWYLTLKLLRYLPWLSLERETTVNLRYA